MNLKSLNNRGAALLQVLILSAILAGMSTMILRVTMARSVAAKQSQHQTKVQRRIESCMAQVNMMWAAKTPDAYARDLAACQMCSAAPVASGGDACSGANTTVLNKTFAANKVYNCGNITGAGADTDVYAVISGSSGNCQIEYVIPGGVGF